MTSYFLKLSIYSKSQGLWGHMSLHVNQRFNGGKYSPECSAAGMGQFPICKLKWDLLRTSFTACTINKNTFSAPFGIRKFEKKFFKKSPIQPPDGVLPIC